MWGVTEKNYGIVARQKPEAWTGRMKAVPPQVK